MEGEDFALGEDTARDGLASTSVGWLTYGDGGRVEEGRSIGVIAFGFGGRGGVGGEGTPSPTTKIEPLFFPVLKG